MLKSNIPDLLPNGFSLKSLFTCFKEMLHILPGTDFLSRWAGHSLEGKMRSGQTKKKIINKIIIIIMQDKLAGLCKFSQWNLITDQLKIWGQYFQFVLETLFLTCLWFSSNFLWIILYFSVLKTHSVYFKAISVQINRGSLSP